MKQVAGVRQLARLLHKGCKPARVAVAQRIHSNTCVAGQVLMLRPSLACTCAEILEYATDI